MRRIKRFSARSLRTGPARLLRDRRATVLIEMAFAIPFFTLLGFGGLEMANLTLAHTRISQIALSTSDNASRMASGTSLTLPTVSEAEIRDTFMAAEKQAIRLNLKAKGLIILSSLERNAQDGQWIHWQRCYGDLKVASSYGLTDAGKTGKTFPGMGATGKEVTAPPGSAIMFVEIVYEYQPLAFGNWLGPRTIRSTGAFNIRENRDLAAGVSASAGVTTATCPVVPKP